MFRVIVSGVLLVASAVAADDAARAAQLRAEAARYRQEAATAPPTKVPLMPGSREHDLWLAAKLEAKASRLDGQPARKVEVSASCCSHCCPRKGSAQS